MIFIKSNYCKKILKSRKVSQVQTKKSTTYGLLVLFISKVLHTVEKLEVGPSYYSGSRNQNNFFLRKAAHFELYLNRHYF